VRDAQCVSPALTVGRIGLHAVANVADLDLLGCIAHGAGGVFEEHLLLLGAHHLEEGAGLGVVLVIVLAVVPLSRTA